MIPLYRDPSSGDNKGMDKIKAKILVNDRKDDRRVRTILANSGEMMESGEVRDLSRLYVMGRDGRLILVSELASDPERQKEEYKVNFALDHGHVVDPEIGEREVDIEDIIGDARVWLSSKGELMARVYFATDDPKADHAYAISENASYSIGTEWYMDGYEGAGNVIEGVVGILREISMVAIGNDPRAHTIDRKPESTRAQRGVEEADGNNKVKKGNIMMSDSKKKLDALTAEEAQALKEELSVVVDTFAAEAEQSTAEGKDAEEETEKKGEKTDNAAEKGEGSEEKTESEDSKNVMRSPVVVIRDRVVRNEKAAKGTDWLHSKEGHVAFADTLKRAGRMGPAFDAMWRDEAGKHMSLDGISGLPSPAPVEQYFSDALEKSNGIISHFAPVNARSFRLHLMAPDTDADLARAHGHKKGSEKVTQTLADKTRDLLCLMVYKRLDLDALEMWENPELIDFRAKELVDAIIVEFERAAIIGDGRTGDAAKSLFQKPRGFYSIVDETKTEDDSIGKYLATKYEGAEDDNLYDHVTMARCGIAAEGPQFLVCKADLLGNLLTDKGGGQYMIQPGTKPEDLLGVTNIYTPTWMNDCEDADAVLVVDKAYMLIGDSGITNRTEFSTEKNQDILLAETPRAGSLSKYHSAAVIKIGASEAA